MHAPLLVISFCLCNCLSHAIGEATPDIIVHINRLSEECDHLDKCQSRHFSDSLEQYNCHCGPLCSQLDTCCWDSPFRDSDVDRKNQRPVCRKVGGIFGSSYFMIDKCPSKSDRNSIYQNLCEDQFINKNNVTSLIPITSLSTNMTYKNYYCFKCHEERVEYLAWTVKVREEGKSYSYQVEDVQLKLQNVNDTWMAPVGKHGSLVPVVFTMDVPPKLENRTKVCIPDMVSICFEKWPNDEIRTRCGMYMSTTLISQHYRNTWYRNPHCALCNFEDLKYAKCARMTRQSYPMHFNSFGRPTPRFVPHHVSSSHTWRRRRPTPRFFSYIYAFTVAPDQIELQTKIIRK